MLIREISDPRLKQIFVTDVKIDRELAFADVYVSAIEGASRSAEILAGLESASGFLRRTLSSRVEIACLSTFAISIGIRHRKMQTRSKRSWQS